MNLGQEATNVSSRLMDALLTGYVCRQCEFIVRTGPGCESTLCVAIIMTDRFCDDVSRRDARRCSVQRASRRGRCYVSSKVYYS